MNLISFLQTQSQTRPEAPALVTGRGANREAVSFGEMEARAERAAGLLRERGVEAGDVVLLLQPMSVELYVAVAAIFRLGAVAMVPDVSAGRDHLAAACRRCPPDAWIGPPKAHLLRLLVPEIRRIPEPFATTRWPIPGATRWTQSPSRTGGVEVRDCSDDDPALVTFTSGSTGTPKAAVRTHGLLTAQYRALRDALGLAPGEVDLATLPIFVLANLAAGTTTVLPDTNLRRPAAVDTRPLAEQIRAETPTRTGGSPALYERVLETGRGDLLRTFDVIATGGAPVFPDFLDRLRNAAPDTEILAVYGSTEAEPIAHVAVSAIREADWAAMREGRGLLTGRPVDAVDLAILPDRFGEPIGPFTEEEFAAATCPPGTAGEIVVAGDHVLPGYLGGVGDEETKFEVDGRRWHRTGDAGRLDDHGRLWLLGRCSARIDVPNDDAGGRDVPIYPFPVECAARTHAGVRRAAYTAHRGDCVLVVEPTADRRSRDASDALDLDALHTALTAALDVPLDAVLRVDAVPVDRRHNAKVDYPALETLLEERR